ncbi:MAG: hypothetical protein ACR2J9_08450 [Gaiellales bacterium]
MSTSTPTPRPVRPTIAVPGGRAVLLAEEVLAGDPDTGDIAIQSLERADGTRFVRMGYRRNGRMIRGPVSLPEDLWTKLPKRPPKPGR